MALTNGAYVSIVEGTTINANAVDLGTGMILGASEEAMIEAHVMALGATVEAYVVLYAKVYQTGVDGSLKETVTDVSSVTASIVMVSNEIIVRVQFGQELLDWSVFFTAQVV